MTRSGRVQLPDHYEHWPLYGPAGLPSEHPDAQREGEETDGDEGASQIRCPVARKTMARITAQSDTESRTARMAPWFEVAGRAGARAAIALAARERVLAPKTMASPR